MKRVLPVAALMLAAPVLAQSSVTLYGIVDAYGQVLDVYRRLRPAIVSVRYGDVMAPPHLFTREFFPELTRLEHGARDLLHRHHARAHVLYLSPDLLMDIDTPGDYELAKARLASDR